MGKYLKLAHEGCQVIAMPQVLVSVARFEPIISFDVEHDDCQNVRSQEVQTDWCLHCIYCTWWA